MNEKPLRSAHDLIKKSQVSFNDMEKSSRWAFNVFARVHSVYIAPDSSVEAEIEAFEIESDNVVNTVTFLSETQEDANYIYEVLYEAKRKDSIVKVCAGYAWANGEGGVHLHDCFAEITNGKWRNLSKLISNRSDTLSLNYEPSAQKPDCWTNSLRLYKWYQKLKSILQVNKHVTLRAEFDTSINVEEESHILEGIAVLTQNIDEYIELVKSSPTQKTANERATKIKWSVQGLSDFFTLVSKYNPNAQVFINTEGKDDILYPLSYVQTEAFGSLGLAQTMQLDIDEITNDYKILHESVSDYRSIRLKNLYEITDNLAESSLLPKIKSLNLQIKSKNQD